MKKDEIKIGETYTAKVTNKVVPVRIDKENPRGGWDATNLATNKQVRIKSVQRLRGRVTGKTANADATEAKPAANEPVKKKLTAADRKARAAELRAQAKADQENARVRDERNASDDGMTDSERAMATSTKPKAKKVKADKKLSLIDAAAQILGKAKEPMATKQMIEIITEQNLWSPRSGGKTPHATLYSAILRELQKKGKDARFQKVERGRFTLAKGA